MINPASFIFDDNSINAQGFDALEYTFVTLSSRLLSRSKVMIRTLRIVCLLLPILLTGCFATYLVDDEPWAELDRLVDVSPQRIALIVHYPTPDVSHGYQFLLGLLPISRVFAESANQVVVARLQFHAAGADVGLYKASPDAKPANRLEVTVSSLDIDGYDLIFFRRPSARVALSGSRFSSKKRPQMCTAVGEHSEIKRFAFAPELNHSLSVATDIAARKLLACLGITNYEDAGFSPTAGGSL